jgi:hypothetical protein
VSGHELSVLDADAEPERTDAAYVGDTAAELSEDEISARGVAGVEVSEGAEVVSGA